MSIVFDKKMLKILLAEYGEQVKIKDLINKFKGDLEDE